MRLWIGTKVEEVLHAMTELRDTQGRFARKPLEELSYRRWHSRLGELREKIGRCACGIEPTEWSYIGSDPRG
jgi:hypothetical protein